VNSVHNVLCSSGWWAKRVETELVPWGLDGADLGEDVLEIGPGFGATTRLLAGRVPRLTAVEVDPGYCRRLRATLGDRVEVAEGDATKLPFEDGRFSGVACFTMLHHITPADSQDKAFQEVARVLRRGGTFAGTDSVGKGPLFKLIHIGDTLNLLDPATLPARLQRAGLTNVTVDRGGRSVRFCARKPA
jgi:ubiquinone/menaquinone biosynthesis C-methylase UbiE